MVAEPQTMQTLSGTGGEPSFSGTADPAHSGIGSESTELGDQTPVAPTFEIGDSKSGA